MSNPEQQAMPLAGLAPATAPARRHARPKVEAQAEYTQIEGGWTYTTDSYGDTRATNLKRGLRTRLKRSVEAARADVHSGRLQKRINGEWTDTIRA